MSLSAPRFLFRAPRSLCTPCRNRFLQRPFSSIPALRADEPLSNGDDFDALLEQRANADTGTPPGPPPNPLRNSPIVSRPGQGQSQNQSQMTGIRFGDLDSLAANTSSDPYRETRNAIIENPRGDPSRKVPTTDEKVFHLHVYATKHNTHINLTNAKKDSLISVSCGNIGFRKAQRGEYDAAYQLGAWVMRTIPIKGADKRWLEDLKEIEVIFKGFGPGREAVTKVLLGNEGRDIRKKITRITDATTLKFGGSRSKAPRRLG